MIVATPAFFSAERCAFALDGALARTDLVESTLYQLHTDGRILTFGCDQVNRALDILMQCNPARDQWRGAKTLLPTPGTRMQAEMVNREVHVFSGSAIQIHTPDVDILWQECRRWPAGRHAGQPTRNGAMLRPVGPRAGHSLVLRAPVLAAEPTRADLHFELPTSSNG